MSDQPTIEERMAQRQACERWVTSVKLAAVQLDGPFDFPSGGGLELGSIFGGSARNRFAICLRCGAVVMLNDPEARPDGPPIERSVRLHLGWHEEVGPR